MLVVNALYVSGLGIEDVPIHCAYQSFIWLWILESAMLHIPAKTATVMDYCFPGHAKTRSERYSV